MRIAVHHVFYMLASVLNCTNITDRWDGRTLLKSYQGCIGIVSGFQGGEGSIREVITINSRTTVLFQIHTHLYTQLIELRRSKIGTRL